MRTLIDDALEVLVVPSFTRIGSSVRRRLFDWEPPTAWSLAGRTVVITGPTSGLGREAAGALARMGARLVLVGRDRAKLERVAAELVAETPGVATAIVVADMSSLASVRAAATEILATVPAIDVLIDNTGAMFMDRTETPEGFERTFATMVVGPFVLLAHLWPRLAAGPDGRVVAVTSGGMYTQGLHLDDLGFTDGTYDGPRAYARAKRAQVVLVREWARRSAGHRSAGRRSGPGRGPVVNAMHPGWADTPGLEASLPGFRRLIGGLLRTPAEGADTILWLAAAPGSSATSGRVYLDRRVRPFDRIPSTRVPAADRRALWDELVRLSGAPDPLA